MGLVQSVLEGMSRLRADAEGGSSGAPAPWDDYWYYPVGSGSSTGMRITADTVKRIACVYACVSVIGKLVASFPLGIYRELDNGGKDLAPKHPIHQLIATRPNEKQTSFEWRQMMQGHLELRGNAYSEIILDGRGWPVQLLPLHPDKVTVEIMRDSRLLRNPAFLAPKWG
jgi:phage portal protein BeeE